VNVPKNKIKLEAVNFGDLFAYFFLSLAPILPISPRIRSFDMVATLSSFIMDGSFSPVCLNSGWVSLIMMSVGVGFRVSLEEMNATTTSFSPSSITSAGLSFVVVRFVNGKGMRTILPFNYLTISNLNVFNGVDIGFFLEEVFEGFFC